MIDPNKDYYGWTQETVEKLRQGKFSEINIDHLIEEIEDMGKNERRGRSWMATIKNQRLNVDEVVDDNPSLKPQLSVKGVLLHQSQREKISMEQSLTAYTQGVFAL